MEHCIEDPTGIKWYIDDDHNDYGNWVWRGGTTDTHIESRPRLPRPPKPQRQNPRKQWNQSQKQKEEKEKIVRKLGGNQTHIKYLKVIGLRG